MLGHLALCKNQICRCQFCQWEKWGSKILGHLSKGVGMGPTDPKAGEWGKGGAITRRRRGTKNTLFRANRYFAPWAPASQGLLPVLESIATTCRFLGDLGLWAGEGLKQWEALISDLSPECWSPFRLQSHPQRHMSSWSSGYRWAVKPHTRTRSERLISDKLLLASISSVQRRDSHLSICIIWREENKPARLSPSSPLPQGRGQSDLRNLGGYVLLWAPASWLGL